jgi:hypothetical protein
VGGKTSTSTSQVQIPPEVLARYNSVNATAQNVAQAPFQQYSTNPNAFVAPLTPTQEAGVANTNTAAGMAQPYFGAATGFALAGAQPVNPAALDTSKYMNPYLQTVLGSTEAMVNQQNQQAQAGQTGNAINQGYFGGDRSGIAAAVLQGQQELAGGQLYSGIASDAYQQALAAAQQQQGVGLAAAQANRAATQQTGETLAGLGTGAQSAALAGAQAQLGAGQVEQQTQQAGDTALYNQFLQQQSYPFQTAQFLANIAEGTGALSGSTTATTQPGGLFSDERLKEDMEPIGKGFDGANIYRFRYKDDPHNITRIGFSAQEMERHHPEAVHEVGGPGGFKAVEQHAATEESARRGGFALAANDNRHEPARAARQGGGGLSEWGSYPEGANPMVIAQLLQSQEGMYAPYSQQGGLYGSSARGAPHGGSSYVPQANLPVGQLQISRPPSQPQSSMMHQAAQDAGDIKTLSDEATKAYDWGKGKFGGKDFDPGQIGGQGEFIDPASLNDTGPPITVDDSGHASGGFIRAARQDGGDINPYGGLGLSIPTAASGAPHQLQTPGAPGAAKSGLSSALDTAGSAAGDISNLAKAGQAVGKGMDWLSSLGSAVPFAEGGFARAHRDLGGDLPDQPVGPGLDIPNQAQQHQLAVAKPPAQGGGGNSTMSDIMDVAKIAAMFAARGGRIGKDDGGLLGDQPDYITSPSDGGGSDSPPPAPARLPPADPKWNPFGQLMIHTVGPAVGAAARDAVSNVPTNPASNSRFGADPLGPPPGDLGAPPPVSRAQMQTLLGPSAAAPPTTAAAAGAAAPTPQAAARAGAATGPGEAVRAHHATHGTGYYVPARSQPPAPTAPQATGFANAAADTAIQGAASGVDNLLGSGAADNEKVQGAAGAVNDLLGSGSGPGFANADVGAMTPHAVPHEGGPPLPATDAQGAPVTPGAISHDTGFGPAARGGPGQPPGAPSPGGFLSGLEHVLGGVGRGVAGLAGYDANTGQWDRDKLIPFINTIAGTLAAPTKYPLVALTQGLQQGAQSYMGQQQREAQIANEQQVALQNRWGMMPDALKQGAVPTLGPDPNGDHTKEFTVGNKLYHVERATDLIPRRGGAPSAGAPSATPGGAPAPGASPPAQGAPLAGLQPPPQGAAGAPQQQGAGGAGAPAQAISADYSGGVPRYTIGPSQAEIDRVRQRYGTDPNDDLIGNRMAVSMAGGPTTEQKTLATEQAQALEGNPLQISQDQANIRDSLQQIEALPETGPGAVGAGQQERQMALQVYNLAGRMFLGDQWKGDASIDAGTTATQILDKLNTLQGNAMNSQYGLHAAETAKQLQGVLPSGHIQKAAAYNILSQMMVANQMSRDFAQYRQQYQRLGLEDSGSVQAFLRDFGSQYNRERAALPRVLARGPKGGPSIFEVLSKDPTQIQRFEQGWDDAAGHHKGYGTGFGRLFAS